MQGGGESGHRQPHTGQVEEKLALLPIRCQDNLYKLFRDGRYFSKTAENHALMVAIHFLHYNLARIHKTLRVTPAMAAGLADYVWSLEEIVLLARGDG